jgi:hypothetical protein
VIFVATVNGNSEWFLFSLFLWVMALYLPVRCNELKDVYFSLVHVRSIDRLFSGLCDFSLTMTTDINRVGKYKSWILKEMFSIVKLLQNNLAILKLYRSPHSKDCTITIIYGCMQSFLTLTHKSNIFLSREKRKVHCTCNMWMWYSQTGMIFADEYV